MKHPRSRKAALAHVAGMIINKPLVVHVDRALTVLSVIGPRLLLDGGADAVDDAKLGAATSGRTVAAGELEITEDGIAIVPAFGTFVKRAFGVEAMSGISTYAAVAAAVNAAAASPQIRGIMLQIDSPGGEVHGMLEVVRAIEAARTVKRVWAHADEMAYSGAYAIASACEQVWVAELGGVGSVGVIAALVDETGADEAAGVKWTIISAGDHKADGHPKVPTSAEAVDAVRAKVLQVNEMFVGLVAKNRKLAPEAVLALQANTYLGQKGVDVGLADHVAQFDDALAAFVAELNGAAAGVASGANVTTSVAAPALELAAEAAPAEAGAAPSSSSSSDGDGADDAAETPPASAGDAPAAPVDLEAARAEGAAAARASEQTRVRAIIAACAKAGEMTLAAAYIADGATVESVEARLGVIAGIRSACAAAGTPELAAELIRRGLDVERAAAEILTRQAEADAARVTTSHLAPAAHAAVGGTLNVRDVYRRYRAATTQGRV